jgi:hypothetical protein
MKKCSRPIFAPEEKCLRPIKNGAKNEKIGNQNLRENN